MAWRNNITLIWGWVYNDDDASGSDEVKNVRSSSK
jgi:hypothetical protein